MSDAKYNGWTNYETWAVKLWMDNEAGSQGYWQDMAKDAWEMTRENHPNRFMNHADNARNELASSIKDAYEDENHPVFLASNGTVYADLLNAALSEVNWSEIAQSLLDDYIETLADPRD